MRYEDLDLDLSRETTPDLKERKLAVLWALGAKLRQLGHKTTCTWRTCKVDGLSLFEIKVQGAKWSWRANERRLRIIVEHYRAYQYHGDARPRQFPEPNKGFDIDKIAMIISAHVNEAKQHKLEEQKNEHAERHSTQELWHAIRDLKLPISHTESSVYGIVTTTTQTIEEEPDQLPDRYQISGDIGRLELKVDSFGKVHGKVIIEESLTLDEAALMPMIERLRCAAGINRGVNWDRDAVAAEQKARWEAEQAEWKAQQEAAQKGQQA